MITYQLLNLAEIKVINNLTITELVLKKLTIT